MFVGRAGVRTEGKAPDYVQVLNEIVETGYSGTELGDWGFMPTDPAEVDRRNSRAQT